MLSPTQTDDFVPDDELMKFFHGKDLTENVLSSASREAIVRARPASREGVRAVVEDTPRGRVLRYPPDEDGKVCEVLIPQERLKEVDVTALRDTLYALMAVAAWEPFVSLGLTPVPQEDATEVVAIMRAIAREHGKPILDGPDLIEHILAHEDKEAPLGKRYRKAVPAYPAAFAKFKEEQRVKRLLRRRKRLNRGKRRSKKSR
jgi:hypothetical protein